MSTHNKRKIRLPRIYQKCASRTTLEKDQIRFTLPWILVCFNAFAVYASARLVAFRCYLDATEVVPGKQEPAKER